jgi:CHAT domain-containing protein/tetratricopeptide (TPR) repeat protein
MANRNKGSLTNHQTDRQSPRSPLVITVRRQRNTVFYDLAEVEPLIRNIQIEFDEHLIHHLIEELKIITVSLNKYQAARLALPLERVRLGDEITAKFKRLGRVIYEQLFPGPIQHALADRPASDLFFRLEDSLLEVPWELTFDGEHFLSRRFHIGRQIITSLPFNRTIDNDRSHQNQGASKLLIIVDPTESLPAAFEETESLADALDQVTRLEVEIIGGKRASKLEVLSALSEFEFVHFAGHSTFDPADSAKTGWLLYDAILSSAEISKISNPPILVFSNSCQSAATQKWDSANSFGQSNLGIGSSFLLAGVRHYVGALWVVHDASSARFASTFYKRLLEGCTIGESLFYAKTEDQGLAGSEALMAAGYVHYGRPDDEVFAHPRVDIHESDATVPSLGSTLSADRSRFGNFVHCRLMRFSLIALLLTVFVCSVVVVFFRSHTSWHPENPISDEYRRGVEAYGKGSIPKALSIFQQLTEREQNRSGLGFGDLAEIYLEAGATEEAKRVLADAAGKPVCSTMTYILKGHLALQGGKHSEAEMAYFQALVMDNGLPEQSAEAYNALGVLYFSSGKKENAIDFFNKAISRQQTNSSALFNLGFLAYLDNVQAKAKDLMTNLVALDPHDEMAQILLELGLNGVGTDGLKPARAGTGREVILIGPFCLRGGTVKRLGFDWVFTHVLNRTLGAAKMSSRYALKTATSLGISTGSSKATDPATLQHKLQPLMIKTAIFGDLDLFRHVAHARIKAMDVTSGAIIRSISITAEDPQKIQRLAERLKDEIAGSFAEETDGETK